MTPQPTPIPPTPLHTTLQHYAALLPTLRTNNISADNLLILHKVSLQPQTMTQIAQLIGISSAAITGSIDRLEKQGYTHRSYDPGDRRKIYVDITGKGKRLLEELETLCAQ